jgi:hypothetical protein
MGKVKVCITLREDLFGGFKSRGLTNLSGAVEEFLEAFLSSLPPEYKRRSAKETRELAKRFLENRQAQENLLQEFLQLLTTFLQILPQRAQTSQLQQEETQPPTQPEPTTQQTNPQKPKQKNRRKTKEN